MADEERMEKIRASAREHDGLYLLPRRYRGPLHEQWKTDTDHTWDACEELVNRGEAQWDRNSTLAPCIRFVNWKPEI